MTLTMADSVTPGNLPGGYDAYAGYIDGRWPDYAAIAAAHNVPCLSVAVTAAADADCLDVETGDATPGQAPAWVRRQAPLVPRPVVYAAASSMAAVLAALTAAGIPRTGVRLWSAHYGAGEHICGPGTCKLTPVAMDGTQWTDTAAGNDGTQIDASVLADDFFEEAAMYVVLHGVPGQWVNPSQFYDVTSETAYVVGVGTDGRVYMSKSVKGAAFTTPVVL